MENNLRIEIDSIVSNISVVRVAVATFVSILDISIDDLMDIKTAVSEAVTNSIEHGYEKYSGKVVIDAKITSGAEDIVTITVKDDGVGIGDIELATTPAYTSKPELEHAGLGFTIMESFMDQIEIDSAINKGTTIKLTKIIKKKKSV
jgi:stage II sporulation protein AB (anti-sigma F factor)